MRGQNASDEADYPAIIFLDQSIDRARAAGDDRQGVVAGHPGPGAAAARRAVPGRGRRRPRPAVGARAALDGVPALAAGAAGGAGPAQRRGRGGRRRLRAVVDAGGAGRRSVLGGDGGPRARPAERRPRRRRHPSGCTGRPALQPHHGPLPLDAGPRPRRRHRHRAGPGRRGARAAFVATLGALAARGEMREQLVRTQLHRHRLGDGGALGTARVLASDIDNPALTALLEDPDRPKVTR